MKKLLLSIAYILAGVSSVTAQTLFGNTLNGGTDGGGSVIKFNTVTNNLATVKSFKINDPVDGSAPTGHLLLATDGKLYGMTTEGGSSNAGVIFSLDPVTSVYSKLVDFDRTNGANPYGTLMQADNGRIYGVTYGGGAYSYGVLFSFDPSSSTYMKLKDFDYANGAESLGGLVEAIDGKLYGMTELGGSNDVGVIFSFDPASSTFAKLKDFDAQSGKFPAGNFVKAADGKLYGVTQQGGSKDSGVIFSFDPLSSAYTKLKDFDYSNGGVPIGSLVQADNAKFYGTTFGGGNEGHGAVFSFDPVSLAYVKLADFDGANGATPYGSLMQASDGRLYGMTSAGGANTYGVIFSIDPASSNFKKLIDYNGISYTRPYFFGEQFVEVKECVSDTTYYRDADGDGYGNPDSTFRGCARPEGYVTDHTDCDDTKAFVHPGAKEICGNNIDDNCNGQVDENCNGVPVITINDITVNESHEIATVTMTLSHATEKPVWILYFTKDGTATSWGRYRDYNAKIGLVVIPAGRLTGTVSIKIIEDNIAEPKEYFDLVLLTSLNGIIADRTGRVFINDESSTTSSISKITSIIGPSKNSFSIKVLSNPSVNEFTLTVESNNKTGQINMKVLNSQGKLLEARNKVSAGETLRLGGSYRPGTYFIEAVQGGQRKAVRVIKLSK